MRLAFLRVTLNQCCRIQGTCTPYTVRSPRIGQYLIDDIPTTTVTRFRMFCHQVLYSYVIIIDETGFGIFFFFLPQPYTRTRTHVCEFWRKADVKYFGLKADLRINKCVKLGAPTHVYISALFPRLPRVHFTFHERSVRFFVDILEFSGNTRHDLRRNRSFIRKEFVCNIRTKIGPSEV
jgi:hypothetical protein